MNADTIFNDFLKPKQSAGRGRKQCPECELYVGVRTYKCECGYQFVDKVPKKEQEQKEDEATDEERLYAMCIGSHGGRFIYTSRGSAPVQLTDITLETICNYCEEVVFKGLDEGNIYTIQAIKNYLQHQLEYNSKEYKQACGYVDQWYNEKLGIDL